MGATEKHLHGIGMKHKNIRESIPEIETRFGTFNEKKKVIHLKRNNWS
jgi:hypothetical protein